MLKEFEVVGLLKTVQELEIFHNFKTKSISEHFNVLSESIKGYSF